MGARRGYLPYPISSDPEHPTKGWHEIKCDECGTIDRMSTAASKGLPVPTIAKKFGARGWDVDTKNMGHGTCAECQRKAKEAKKIRLVHSKPLQPLEPAMFENKIPQPVIVAPTPSLKDFVPQKAEQPKEMGLDEMLLVLGVIETHYDPKTGYSDGYSDQKVADELNCPLKWVRDVRTKKFGQLPETPVIIEIRKQIRDLDTKIETLKTNMQMDERTFNQRLDNLRTDYRSAVERFDLRTVNLKKAQDELTARLNEALAKL